MKLRDYQQGLADETSQAFEEGFNAPVLVLPTGGGKTPIFCYIADRAASLGNRICLVGHRRELIKQASNQLKKFGLDHGIIAPGFPETRHLIQVASVQTLVRRKHLKFHLFVFDEGHHGAANTWLEIIQQNPEAGLLGVTATPVRPSGKGMGLADVYDRMIVGPSVQNLIDRKFLSPVKFFKTGDVDVSKLRVKFGEYKTDELDALVNRREITGCAIEQYIKHCNGMPAIAFCHSVQHAEAVAEDFRAAGYRAASVDCRLDDEERDARIRGLGDGTYNILSSYQLISEGVDVPVVTGCIDLGASKSLVKVMQSWGRCMRPYPGKPHAVVLDHVGNYLRHGLPWFDREWSLEHGIIQPEEDKGPRVRQCRRCYCVHDWAPECPDCGFNYPPEPKPAPRAVDGDLELVSEEEARALYDIAKRSGKLDDFHKWAKATGKKPGAAWHAFKRRKAGRKLGGMRV